MPPFWNHFGATVGAMLEVVFAKKRSFTYMGAHFSKVAMCFSVFMLFVGILEIAVLLALEVNFRDFV